MCVELYTHTTSTEKPRLLDVESLRYFTSISIMNIDLLYHRQASQTLTVNTHHKNAITINIFIETSDIKPLHFSSPIENVTEFKINTNIYELDRFVIDGYEMVPT